MISSETFCRSLALVLPSVRLGRDETRARTSRGTRRARRVRVDSSFVGYGRRSRLAYAPTKASFGQNSKTGEALETRHQSDEGAPRGSHGRPIPPSRHRCVARCRVGRVTALVLTRHAPRRGPGSAAAARRPRLPLRVSRAEALDARGGDPVPLGLATSHLVSVRGALAPTRPGHAAGGRRPRCAPVPHASRCVDRREA